MWRLPPSVWRCGSARPVRLRELVRGALLHDYFGYDWHEKGGGHRLHGFFHPKRACHRAEKKYALTRVERGIILRHMWPLTLRRRVRARRGS